MFDFCSAWDKNVYKHPYTEEDIELFSDEFKYIIKNRCSDLAEKYTKNKLCDSYVQDPRIDPATGDDINDKQIFYDKLCEKEIILNAELKKIKDGWQDARELLVEIDSKIANIQDLQESMRKYNNVDIRKLSHDDLDKFDRYIEKISDLESELLDLYDILIYEQQYLTDKLEELLIENEDMYDRLADNYEEILSRKIEKNDIQDLLDEHRQIYQDISAKIANELQEQEYENARDILGESRELRDEVKRFGQKTELPSLTLSGRRSTVSVRRSNIWKHSGSFGSQRRINSKSASRSFRSQEIIDLKSASGSFGSQKSMNLKSASRSFKSQTGIEIKSASRLSEPPIYRKSKQSRKLTKSNIHRQTRDVEPDINDYSCDSLNGMLIRNQSTCYIDSALMALIGPRILFVDRFLMGQTRGDFPDLQAQIKAVARFIRHSSHEAYEIENTLALINSRWAIGVQNDASELLPTLLNSMSEDPVAGVDEQGSILASNGLIFITYHDFRSARQHSRNIDVETFVSNSNLIFAEMLFVVTQRTSMEAHHENNPELDHIINEYKFLQSTGGSTQKLEYLQEQFLQIHDKIEKERFIYDEIIYPYVLNVNGNSLELKSIICYSGSGDMGHYVTYFICDGTWYYYDNQQGTIMISIDINNAIKMSNVLVYG